MFCTAYTVPGSWLCLAVTAHPYLLRAPSIGIYNRISFFHQRSYLYTRYTYLRICISSSINEPRKCPNTFYFTSPHSFFLLHLQLLKCCFMSYLDGKGIMMTIFSIFWRNLRLGGFTMLPPRTSKHVPTAGTYSPFLSFPNP